MAVALKGIDIRQAGAQVIIEVLLTDVAGDIITGGTTEIRLYRVENDGTLLGFDFDSPYDFTSAPTNDEGTMTHRQVNAIDSGIWTLEFDELGNWVVDDVYIAWIYNSTASPTTQARKFQYGGGQGADVVQLSESTAAADRLELLALYGDYEGRMIWFDSVNGAAGAVDNVNGTKGNPVSSFANAITLAASLNINHYHALEGSTVTLTQDFADTTFTGSSWAIIAGGYDLSNAYIHNAFVFGSSSTSDTNNSNFTGCYLLGHTAGSAVLVDCFIGNDFTISEVANYVFNNCREAIGTSQAAIDFDSAGGAEVQLDNFAGTIELKNMATGDVINIYGNGGVIINANCADGTINRIGGNFFITDNAGGNVTVVNEVARFGTDQQVKADVTAVSGSSDAADNLELQYDGTGLIGDKFPATQEQLATIGGGVTLGSAAIADTVTDGAATNDYEATAAHDGVLFIITDNDNSDPGIDGQLRYKLAADQSISHYHFHGWYQDGQAPFTNQCYVQAYNWEGTSWDTIETLDHATAEQPHNPFLLARNVSTTSNGPGGEAGHIYIRFLQAAQDSGSGSTINIDHAVAHYVNPALSAADVWAYILAEIAVSSDPGATPTAAQALMLEYMKSRNRHDASASEEIIYNDAGAKILERDLTDVAAVASASKVRNPT